MQFIAGTDGKMLKKPMVKWKEFQETQPLPWEIDEWLANGWFLGIITGHLSGIIIVDDDRIKHGLQPTKAFDSTIIARTKSGGTHYYFKYTRPISNHANPELHIDIRGEGGYCVLPPFNGYAWVKEPTAEAIANLPEFTEAMEKSIVGEKKQGERVSLSEHAVIPDGGRNDTLYRLACSIFNNDKLSEPDKILQIEWINETKCKDKDGNPHPLPASELQVIINQAKNFVLNNPKTTTVLEAPQEARALADVISDRLEEKELEKGCPITGLSKLDNMVKGFVPKHVYVLTGDTNVGKTSLACFFACAVASQQKKVLYVALEPDTGVVDYIASIYHNKTFDSLDPNTDYNFGDLPIEIYQKTQVRTVDGLIQALKTGKRYDLIIIDHIGYFVNNTTNTNQEQSNVMKKLAEIASENLCSVMAIAHIRKPDGHTKKNKIPTMNDISGSASFKQDATDVWIVYREPDPEDETHTKYLSTGMLIVGKSKSGMTGPVPITFGYRKAGIWEQEQIIDSIEDNFL
jgi:archaellum biogenesis ATPase FlaH